MIANYDDLSLWVYVLVYNMCQALAGQLRRPGPQPLCSDSELIAICLIGECRRWDLETELLCQYAGTSGLVSHLARADRADSTDSGGS